MAVILGVNARRHNTVASDVVVLCQEKTAGLQEFDRSHTLPNMLL